METTVTKTKKITIQNAERDNRIYNIQITTEKIEATCTNETVSNIYFGIFSELGSLFKSKKEKAQKNKNITIPSSEPIQIKLTQDYLIIQHKDQTYTTFKIQRDTSNALCNTLPQIFDERFTYQP